MYIEKKSGIIRNIRKLSNLQGELTRDARLCPVFRYTSTGVCVPGFGGILKTESEDEDEMDNYMAVLTAQQKKEEFPGQEGFCCSLYIQHSTSFLLCDATAAFLERFQIQPQDLNKNIYGLLKKKLPFLPELLACAGDEPWNLHYFTELEEGTGSSFWEIELESAPPFLHFSGHRCSAQQIASRYCTENAVDLSAFYVPGHQSVLLGKDERGIYRIRSCNASAARLYSAGAEAGGGIRQVFSFLRTARLFSSGTEGKSLCFYELLPGEGNAGRHFVRVLCLTVEQGDEKSFLLLSAPCSAREFFERYGGGAKTGENNFENCPYAVAYFSFPQGNPVPESFNRCCSALIRDGLSLSELLQTEAVIRSFENRLPCTALAKIDGSRYEVSALPILQENRIGQMMVIVVPSAGEPEFRAAVSTDRLTPREHETLNLAAQGYPNRYIAHRLSISEGTVKKLIYNGYQKLGISSRVELCRMISPQAAAF